MSHIILQSTRIWDALKAEWSTNGGSRIWETLREEWNSNEHFRLIMVAYLNVLVLMLVYTYVFLRVVNQCMREKMQKMNRAKKRAAAVRVWSTQGTQQQGGSNDHAKLSYYRLPTPEQ